MVSALIANFAFDKLITYLFWIFIESDIEHAIKLMASGKLSVQKDLKHPTGSTSGADGRQGKQPGEGARNLQQGHIQPEDPPFLKACAA